MYFAFRVTGFSCTVSKAMPVIPSHEGGYVCPFLYPYLRLVVNRRLQTLRLAESPYPPTYDFGTVELPTGTVVEQVDGYISLYFNTSFDILNNTNRTLDLNRDVRGGDYVMLDWSAERPDPSSPFTQRGDFTCAHVASTELAAVEEATPSADPPCRFSRFTPGFWDQAARNFVPAGCTYQARAWPQGRVEDRGMVWIHLLGDSNMRKLHGAVCRHIGANVTYHGHRHPPRPGQALVWSACFTRDMTAAVVHSVSWMTGRFSLDTSMSPQFVGRTLSSALCRYTVKQDGEERAVPAALCDEAWNVTAQRTVILVGSHSHDQLIPAARRDVAGWVDGIAQRMERPETLSVMLVTAVCVRHFVEFARFSDQLFQRNNYRIRGINEATVDVMEPLGVPWMDAFSVTLAAGCKEESSDVVHFRDNPYIELCKLLFSFLSINLQVLSKAEVLTAKSE